MGLKNYTYNNGVFNISTISPNSLFYYRIKTPKSINMSNFASKIALFGIDDNLIYYNENTLAHWLFSKHYKSNEFVFWSNTGNELAFYEYLPSNFKFVIINLKEKYCYKFDLNLYENKFKDIDNGFNFNEIDELAKNKKIPKEQLITNNFSENIFNKWYPKK